MNPTVRNWALFLLMAAISQNAVTAAQSTKQTETDEVLVRGERIKLDEMRKEIVRLEDKFYERYNEVNTVDDFDIHCIEEARTGTRFVKRSCLAVYQERAIAEEGQAAFKIQQRFREGGGPVVADSSPPPPATMTVLRRLPEYKKNLEEVARKDPELRRLLEQRSGLIQRYDAARHRIFGRNPQPDDSEAAVSVMPDKIRE